ncbi:YifE [Vibrio furnissii]|nr:YifE [Vibrio furnissii]
MTIKNFCFSFRDFTPNFRREPRLRSGSIYSHEVDMSETVFRQGKKRFFDTKKFPRGFAKSGDFTLAEEDTLSLYGETLVGLETGALQPENAEEQHFMDVLVNPDLAQSKIERVWMKYVRLSRGRKRFHTLNGRNKPDAADDYTDDEPSLTEED